MSLSFQRLPALVVSGLAAGGWLMHSPVWAEEPREVVIERVVVEGKEGGKEEKKNDDDDDKPAKTNFWIGIALEGQSAEEMVIAEVYPDSPALQAGLKKGDRLLAVGDDKIKGAEELVASVQGSGGKPMKLKLLREGKEQVVEVTPVKRPDALNRFTPPVSPPETAKPAQPGAAPQAQWTPVPTPPRAAGSGASGGGSAFPPATPRAARIALATEPSQLPEDMEVTIAKKGNHPAIVVATQGEKLWKTTENELDMLPPPAQAYAASLLGKDLPRARRMGGGAGMMPGMGMGMPGMGGMGAAPGMSGGGVRRVEVRRNKDGQLEAIQEGKNAPNFQVLPGGGLRVEVREGNDEQEGTSDRKEETKKPAAEKDDPERARRIRDLQEQAERLRALLEKLREETKERK